MSLLALETNDEGARARLTQWPDGLSARLSVAFVDIGATLQAAVEAKLDGGAVRAGSGRLRSAVTVAVDESSAEVGLDLAAAPYGAALEFGASIPAQLMAAKTARALAFVVGGNKVFAKQVMRPAFTLAPHSFLRAALEETRSGLLAQLDDAVSEAAQT